MTKSKQKQETYAIIAGVIYIILAMYNFIDWWITDYYHSDFQVLIRPVLLVGMATTLFIKNKKAVAFAAGANALFCIIGFAHGIYNIFFGYPRITSFSLWTLLYVLFSLFKLFAYISLIIISVVPFKKSQTIKKLWYVPGVLFLLGTIICFFIQI